MKLRAADGFTLLEMLLAISLVALIVSSIMGGVHLGRRTWEATRASEALDEVERAVRGVATLIARSFPLPPAPGPAPPVPSFLGSPEGCRFVALSEGGAQWAGLVLTEIGLDAERDGGLAVWTKVFRPREGASLPRAAMRRTAILSDLAFFRLAFFGAQEEGRPATWSQGWNNPKVLPELVSIRLGANRLGRVLEVEATVALRQR